MLKPFYTRNDLSINSYSNNETVVTSTSYDPHCSGGKITDGCKPVAVITGDKLIDHTEGPAKTAAIASVLNNDVRWVSYIEFNFI